MINFDDVTNENIKEHNPNWAQILDHPYKISIEDSWSGQTNSLSKGGISSWMTW